MGPDSLSGPPYTLSRATGAVAGCCKRAYIEDTLRREMVLSKYSPERTPVDLLSIPYRQPQALLPTDGLPSLGKHQKHHNFDHVGVQGLDLKSLRVGQYSSLRLLTDQKFWHSQIARQVVIPGSSGQHSAAFLTLVASLSRCITPSSATRT